MRTIDADAHVLESPATWQFMTEAEQRFAPVVLEQNEGRTQLGLNGNVQKEFWLIDGRMHNKQLNIGLNTPAEARELKDIDVRLRHMDELDVDIQVLYPSLFLRPLTLKREVELALTRSYNRWLAEIWKKGRGRLAWVALPALLSMDTIRDEMAWCKEHGACGVFVRGIEYDRLISDSYYFPLFEIAAELDMAIAMHSGINSFAYHEMFKEDRGFLRFQYPGVAGFYSLLAQDVPAKFPTLRWGFVEMAAQWLPHAISGLKLLWADTDRTVGTDILKKNNMYVACQISDDIPYLLKWVGEDSLMIGTDYGHHDTASEIEALRKLRDEAKIDSTAVDKILWDNPRALYQLD